MGYIEFSKDLHPFGLALLELAGAEYEDLDSAVIDMAEATGNQPEDILALIQGEYLPSEEVVESLADLFDNTREDDDVFDRFVDSAQLSWEIFQDAYEAELEDDEAGDDYDVDYEYDEEYPEEEDDNEDYDGYDDEDYDDEDTVEGLAEVSDLQYRLHAAEEALINFERQQQVSSALADIADEASRLVQSGHLPPRAFQLLIGNNEKDRTANFSAAAASNGMTEEDHLAAVEFALGVFRECGPFVSFSSATAEDPIERDARLDAQEAALSAYKLMKGDR